MLCALLEWCVPMQQTAVRDFSSLGSILGSPYLGELSFGWLADYRPVARSTSVPQLYKHGSTPGKPVCSCAPTYFSPSS